MHIKKMHEGIAKFSRKAIQATFHVKCGHWCQFTKLNFFKCIQDVLIGFFSV